MSAARLARVSSGRATESGMTYREKARQRALDKLAEPARDRKELRRVKDHVDRVIFRDLSKKAKQVYRGEGTIEEKRAAVRALRKSQEVLHKELRDEKNIVVQRNCKERPEPGPKKDHGGGGASRAFIPWCEENRRKKK